MTARVYVTLKKAVLDPRARQCNDRSGVSWRSRRGAVKADKKINGLLASPRALSIEIKTKKQKSIVDGVHFISAP